MNIHQVMAWSSDVVACRDGSGQRSLLPIGCLEAVIDRQTLHHTRRDMAVN